VVARRVTLADSTHGIYALKSEIKFEYIVMAALSDLVRDCNTFSGNALNICRLISRSITDLTWYPLLYFRVLGGI
jgi:hypothetical protein